MQYSERASSKTRKTTKCSQSYSTLSLGETREAAILDPYAGSGTTGHAVISMNAEDEGSRQFVLIDSGDPRKDAPFPRGKYTAKITAERVRRVITGQWADEKDHPFYETGFLFHRAKESDNKSGDHGVH